MDYIDDLLYNNAPLTDAIRNTLTFDLRASATMLVERMNVMLDATRQFLYIIKQVPQLMEFIRDESIIPQVLFIGYEQGVFPQTWLTKRVIYNNTKKLILNAPEMMVEHPLVVDTSLIHPVLIANNWQAFKEARKHSGFGFTISVAIEMDKVNILQNHTYAPKFDPSHRIDGHSLLELSIMWNAPKCFAYLLRIDRGSDNALDLAVGCGRIDMIQSLELHGCMYFPKCLAAGARTWRNSLIKEIIQNKNCYSTEESLEAAIPARNRMAVDLFIDNGAHVNSKCINMAIVYMSDLALTWSTLIGIHYSKCSLSFGAFKFGTMQLAVAVAGTNPSIEFVAALGREPFDPELANLCIRKGAEFNDMPSLYQYCQTVDAYRYGKSLGIRELEAPEQLRTVEAFLPEAVGNGLRLSCNGPNWWEALQTVNDIPILIEAGADFRETRGNQHLLDFYFNNPSPFAVEVIHKLLQDGLAIYNDVERETECKSPYQKRVGILQMYQYIPSSTDPSLL